MEACLTIEIYLHGITSLRKGSSQHGIYDLWIHVEGLIAPCKGIEPELFLLGQIIKFRFHGSKAKRDMLIC